MKNNSRENENLVCPYCSAIIGLSNFNRHKKGAKCEKYKKHYFNVHKEKNESEIELYINKLKSQLKNSDYFDDESITT